MDKAQLWECLSSQDTAALLDLLSKAYDEMDRDQREAVFGRLVRTLPPAPVEGEELLDEVEEMLKKTGRDKQIHQF